MPGSRPDLPGVWLLDLEVGGHVHRYATEPVNVDDIGGRTHHYREGLAEPGASFGAAIGVGDASVSVTITSAVDWALLVERGQQLDRCRATLRRWFDGRTLERCRVVLRGLTSAPSYGAQGEPLKITIVRSMRAQTRTWPPAQAVIDASTWPVTGGGYVSPDTMQGAAYPLVIGAPGGTEDATPICVVPVPTAEHPATVGDGTLVWIGGHASTVRVGATGEPTIETDETITETDDLLGRNVQTAAASTDFNLGDSYLLGFRDDGVYGGGLLYEGELLRGAGDVIVWLLREYFAGLVDFGRVAAVRGYLNNWKIDTYVNAGVNLWDWLAAEVLPLLPVEFREGNDGVYPALLRWDLTTRDAVAHLDATAGSGRVDRDGPVTLIASIANEITVEYRPGAESGSTWLGRRVVTARGGVLSDDEVEVDDSRVLASYLCFESQRRYGVLPLRVQAGAVWDTPTAVLTAHHLVARRAWPRRAVRYTGGAWLEDIEVGQAVTVTDPDLHLSSAVALVVDVTPTAGGAAVDLLLLDHPVGRRRSTA